VIFPLEGKMLAQRIGLGQGEEARELDQLGISHPHPLAVRDRP